MSRTEDTLRECGRWICHSFDILKAIIIRVIFALHATIAIIRITINQGDYWYLLNMCGVNFLLIELVITIIKRKGKEPKWFSPCFFLYICTMIPPIWFLEINRINVKLGRGPVNQTEGEALKIMIQQGVISKANINDGAMEQLGLDDTMAIELAFMYIIILGRWIIPKGNISHSALSQLLLVYLSLASDISDLFTLFNEKEIYMSLSMVHIVLIAYSLGMIQFAFNLTATRGRSFHAEFDETEIEIHQSVPKPPSKTRPFLEIFMPKTKSSSTARPLKATAGSPVIRPKPRAASFSVVQPPDTIFENTEADKEYEMQENRNIRIPAPTFTAFDPPISIISPPTPQRPSTTSLNSLPSSVWNTPRSRNTPRKSIAESVKFFVKKRSAKLLRSEIWSILVTLSLQDGPFLAVRLVAIFVYRVRSFSTYFFTFKNFLILILQTYRIASICLEKDEQEEEFEEKINTIRRMSIAASQLGIPLNRKI